MPEAYYQDAHVTLYHGDCREILPTLASAYGRIATCLTDPPYHLTTPVAMRRSAFPGRYADRPGATRGFMGKTWDGGDVAFQAATWEAVCDALAPGGLLLAFGGTRTFHRLACAIEDAGWELRDTCMWLHAQGWPKSLDISKALDKAAGAARQVVGAGHSGRTAGMQQLGPSGIQGGVFDLTAPSTPDAQRWHGWGTALAPAWEPILLAQKPLAGTYAQNALVHGVAGLNIDGGRIAWEPGGRAGQERTSPRISPAPMDWGKGKMVGRDYAPPPAGRWPKNVLFTCACDGAHAPDCPVARLDAQAGERSVGGPNHSRSETTDAVYGTFPQRSCIGYGDTGSASRFFYCAKASRRERGEGNTHPTVKPQALLRYLLTLTQTPTGGLVLDPFCGSASTLLAARALGRPSLGIERDEASCEIAACRLERTAQEEAA